MKRKLGVSQFKMIGTKNEAKKLSKPLLKNNALCMNRSQSNKDEGNFVLKQRLLSYKIKSGFTFLLL